MPKKRLAILCLYLVAIFAVPRLLDAQTQPAAPHAGKESVRSKSLLDMYRDGGWVMHVIAACSIGTIAVMTYCVLQINRRKLLPAQVVSQLNQQLSERDLNAAFHLR